eukprot:Skav227989  [mRNA]  locus=scaffold390:26376:33209:+ [translate_table: standard]
MRSQIRPDAVEALTWEELADVSVAYASLRLFSQSLFGAALRGTPEPQAPVTESQGSLLRLPSVEDVWQSLEAQEIPGEPTGGLHPGSLEDPQEVLASEQIEVIGVAAIVPGLFRSQSALDFPAQQRSWGSAQSDLQRPMEHAAIQAMRRISGEVLRREDESAQAESIASIQEMRNVLEGHGVQTAWVVEDVRTLKEDSIAQ